MQEQYIFIHDAILESVICGNTEISPENFRQVVSNLRMVDKKDGKIQLQREYEVIIHFGYLSFCLFVCLFICLFIYLLCVCKVLGLVSPKQSDVVHIVASQHPDRNRSQDFLPCKVHWCRNIRIMSILNWGRKVCVCVCVLGGGVWVVREGM